MWLKAKNIQSNQPEKIQILQNLKEYWSKSISAEVIKRIGNSQCIQ